MCPVGSRMQRANAATQEVALHEIVRVEVRAPENLHIVFNTYAQIEFYIRQSTRRLQLWGRQARQKLAIEAAAS